MRHFSYYFYIPYDISHGLSYRFDLVFDPVFLTKRLYQRRHFVEVVARHGREQTERKGVELLRK